MSEKYLGEEGTSRLIAKVKGYSQPRTLVSPITIGGQSQTTVETALSALNNAKCEQVSTMPTAGSSYLNKVYQFIGTTTSSFKSGCFYKCVSDGGDPATYSWELLVGDIPVDNTTIVKDGTTGELTAVQATTSTLGVVKGGDGTQISNAGGINVVNRLEETDALPTAASTNLNKCYLLKGTQSGYQTGAIYQCRLVAGSDPAEYEWVLISANPLTFDSEDFDVVNDEVSLDASQKIKTFTQAEWDALTSAEKIALAGQNVIISDDEGTQTFEDIIPSDASASNKLATEGYVNSVCKNIQNTYDGGVYTTDTALITKIVEDVKALAETGKNVGGNISAVWTGKSFISGGYSLYGSSSGLVLLDFENATADGTHCQISINGSSTVVTWFTPAMVSIPQNGLITITSVSGDNANATTTYTNVGVGDLVNVVIDSGVLFIPSWWGTVSGLSSLGITNIQNIQGISGECRILARVCKTNGSMYLDFLRDSGVATKSDLPKQFVTTSQGEFFAHVMDELGLSDYPNRFAYEVFGSTSNKCYSKGVIYRDSSSSSCNVYGYSHNCTVVSNDGGAIAVYDETRTTAIIDATIVFTRIN